MLAISEAFTNAMIHGNKLSPEKMIEVAITVNDDYIIADITDEGEGFKRKPSPEYPSDPMAEGGRGVGLMKSIADEVRFSSGGNGRGVRVSLRFIKERVLTSDKSANNLEGDMDFRRRDEGQVTIVYLSGRLDLGAGNRLKEDIKVVLASGKTCIHLNLKEVEFVNSSGLGALVSILKEARIHRGRLTLSDMADYVREIFDITQLSHIFEIFATEQEALHSYQPVAVN